MVTAERDVGRLDVPEDLVDEVEAQVSWLFWLFSPVTIYWEKCFMKITCSCLRVIEGDSWKRGCKFESQHQTLPWWIFFTFNLFLFCIFKKTENQQNRGYGVAIENFCMIFVLSRNAGFQSSRGSPGSSISWQRRSSSRSIRTRGQREERKARQGRGRKAEEKVNLFSLIFCWQVTIIFRRTRLSARFLKDNKHFIWNYLICSLFQYLSRVTLLT